MTREERAALKALISKRQKERYIRHKKLWRATLPDPEGAVWGMVNRHMGSELKK